MQRIMIIGCCGAGKSTLARQLHKRTGLPLIHLDQHYWQPGWVEPETGEWEASSLILANQDRWIIDGNYGGTIDIRLKKADMIVFLDRSRWICTYRILKRSFFSFGKTRPDMTEGCVERFDWEFLVYTFTFWDRKRPGLLKKLEKWKQKKRVIHLQSDQDINIFLTQF